MDGHIYVTVLISVRSRSDVDDCCTVSIVMIVLMFRYDNEPHTYDSDEYDTDDTADDCNQHLRHPMERASFNYFHSGILMDGWMDGSRRDGRTMIQQLTLFNIQQRAFFCYPSVKNERSLIQLPPCSLRFIDNSFL